MIHFYGYTHCDTCRKAKKYLQSKHLAFKEMDITATPPSQKLLKTILENSDYQLKDLFNRSGQLYRQLHMKDRLPTMKQADLVTLLAQHGKLVKRPIVTDGRIHTVGYKEDLFHKAWG